MIFQLQPKAIISKPPIELMNQQNFIDIPVMIGYNSAEGIVTLPDIYKKMDAYENDLARMIPRSLNVPNELPTGMEAQKLAEEIRKLYFDGQAISEKLLSEISNLTTDYHFGIGAHLYAETHSRRQPK